MKTRLEQGKRFSPASLSRRAVLIAGAWLPLTPLARAASATPPPGSKQAEKAILAMVKNRQSAIELGKAAQIMWPEMRDRKGLLAQILDDLGLNAAAAVQAQTTELGKRLSHRIQMDFSEGRTVNLDGWLLSSAEVRFYALSAFADWSAMT
jgi:hypothetical protein